MKKFVLPFCICLIALTTISATHSKQDKPSHQILNYQAIKTATKIHTDKCKAIYAYVYIDPANTVTISTQSFLLTTPVLFNTQGPSQKIDYDFKTGELIVPSSGDYEIIINTIEQDLTRYVLWLNKVPISQKFGVITPNTITYVLHLHKNDHVLLTLEDEFLFTEIKSNFNLSLFIRKL